MKMGSLDFAGGTVVHLSSGISALVLCLFLGKRKGFPHERMAPHNLPMTLLGAGLLWFGWFGFNAGSALCAGGGAALAFTTTQTAAAAAALSWMLLEWILAGKPSALGIASGIGGAFGALATGIFATVGATSVLTGDFHQLYVQFVGIAAATAYAATITTILLLILKATMGLRVNHEDEITGLDQTAHSEAGYNF